MTEYLPWVLPTLGFVGLIGLQWQNQRSVDAKISRAYQRLDEVKEANKSEFSSQAVCNEKHQTLNRDLQEIKEDIKFLVRKANGTK